MKRLFTILTLMMLVSLPAFAGVGTTGAQFLKVNASAVSSSLGGVRSVSSGAESMFLNPSGLATVSQNELSFSQVMWLEDISFSNMAFGHRAAGGVIGLGVQYLSVPPITKFDNTGTELSDSYSPTDMAVVLGWAGDISGTLLGANVKYISSKLDTQTASAYAVDLGIQKYNVRLNRIIGVAVHNIGTKMKYVKDEDPLPFDILLGFKQSFIMGRNKKTGQIVSLYMDAGHYNDSGTVFAGGTEYLRKLGEFKVSLRAGYRTDIKALDGLSGVACGLGIIFRNSKIDYALAPYGELGLTHRVSLAYSF